MTEKKKETSKGGVVELNEEETKAVSGGTTKLTGESLSSTPGGLPESRANPKKKPIVQCYPAVEYD